ncbi:Increased DNA methylation 1 [Camellia lanceoleosa]|uniref:Increased DNA methylation 1 n=1 Tax=Camellia lanceoleosa TaxID=1840588 RepID=A0ACC0IAV9_9ERIC|nr:Increased DNA methylation 1 [Camellia lanceoleosa]
MKHRRKLLLHERVEVRQFEEGLRGSWHPAVVVDVSHLCRSVEYDKLLCEGSEAKLIESITVTKAVEGEYHRGHTPVHYRGNIRPQPLLSRPKYCKTRFKFGTCVDAFYRGAWWEGVIFDCNDDSMVRSVYFPDEGDELKFRVTSLRISQDWDEFLDSWKERCSWVLVDLSNQQGVDAQFIKMVWQRLQLNCGFGKMISEWTCGSHNLWNVYFMEVITQIALELSQLDPRNPECTVRKQGRKPKNTHLTDSHYCLNSDAQGKNPNNLNVDESSLNEKERAFPAEAKQKNHSLKMKSKLKKSKHPVGDRANELSSQAENSCWEKQLKAGASLNQNKCQKEQLRNLVINGHSSKNKDGNCVSLPPQTKKSLAFEYEQELERVRSLIVCDGVDDHSLICCQTREKENVNDVPVLQRNESLQDDCEVTTKNFVGKTKIKSSHLIPSKRRMKLRQPEQRKCNSAPGFSISSHRQRIYINKQDNLLMGQRVSRKFQQASAKIKSLHEAEGKENGFSQTKGHLKDIHSQKALPFTNSGNTVGFKDIVSCPRKQKRKRKRKRGYLGCYQNDTICMVCHFGGELILCDHCPSSYHLTCIDLKDVPEGKWFCPGCQCGLCCVRDACSDKRLFTEVCRQCTRQYHVDCLIKAGFLFPRNYPGETFCSQKCFELCAHLHQQLGISNSTSINGLSWKMIRSRKNYCSFRDKKWTDASSLLSRACDLLQACFQPVIEPHCKRDLVVDVMFNSVSKFKRLDFRGFYVLVLQNGDKLVSVATVRIHGQQVAEMPLVGTHSKYRRLGMCRLLLHELEKMLTQMGIQRLVVPAISESKEIWKTSFGFSEMSLPERLELLGYPFLVFQGTTLFHKVLSKSVTTKDTRDLARELEEPMKNNPEVSTDCQVRLGCERRFYGLQYKRKSKPEITGKENTNMYLNGN